MNERQCIGESSDREVVMCGGQMCKFGILKHEIHVRKIKWLFPPGIEPGAFRVLGGCDNHYTTETPDIWR